MAETPDELRTRRLAINYDHTHDTTHALIPNVGGGHQDVNDVQPCCGRTVPQGSTVTPAQPWKHALDCVNYQPHPSSIAANGGL